MVILLPEGCIRRHRVHGLPARRASPASVNSDVFANAEYKRRPTNVAERPVARVRGGGGLGRELCRDQGGPAWRAADAARRAALHVCRAAGGVFREAAAYPMVLAPRR